jgi:competence protein ComEA
LSLAAASAWLQVVRRSPWWTAAAGALAVVVLGAVAWAAFRPGANPPPIELELPRADAPSSASSSASEGATTSGAAPERPAGAVIVHVAGAVVAPGLYRLGGDARVADALDAAGGPAPDAELDAVNLAAKVADGERVYVPRKGEAPPAVVGAAGAAGGGGAPAGPLDLNTATADQLDALPGVGPATAEAILAYRQEKGRFRSVDELLEVRGIGQAKLATLRSKVTVR